MGLKMTKCFLNWVDKHFKIFLELDFTRMLLNSRQKILDTFQGQADSKI